MAERPWRLALVLGGGNALGAYLAGAWEAIEGAGLVPDRIAGASIGAITGALVCGCPPEERLARLRAFWGVHTGTRAPADAPGPLDIARRTGAALRTMAIGEPRLFVPRNLYGPWWNPYARDEPSSLYDPAPLQALLDRLIDFDRLNAGPIRYAATAIDIETGDDIVFDTAHGRITPEHVRASAALLPVLPPVEIGGRLMGDAGLSANLPIDSVLAEPGEGPLVCLAIDLLPLAAPRPATLGDTLTRMQDLAFATQSRRAIAAWSAILRGRTPPITLIHVPYRDQAREVSGKAFDFSPETIAARWQAGRSDLAPVAARLAAGELPIGPSGLTAWRAEGERLLPIDTPLAPLRGSTLIDPS